MKVGVLGLLEHRGQLGLCRRAASSNVWDLDCGGASDLRLLDSAALRLVRMVVVTGRRRNVEGRITVEEPVRLEH